MAGRSLLLNLRRIASTSGATSTSNNHPLFLRPSSTTTSFVQSFSSEALSTESLDGSPSLTSESDDLKSRIFRLRLPKRSVSNVIQRWVSEGNQVSISDLRDISKELRKSHRYKHALEISEWMVSCDEFKLQDSDYAVRIVLMTKVFGIDAAERYFEGLPDAAKTNETYTALLHSYAVVKFTEKAEELFERMKDSGLSFSAITYNEMMTLYMSVGQVEKVSSVVEELKCKNVVPDLFTYNLWASSCAAALDISGLRSVLDEMSQHLHCSENWLRYKNLANIYITVGQLKNSSLNCMIVEAEKGITQRELITYDFLVILHAGLGNKDKIDQIWKSLRTSIQKMMSRNYVCVLSSYLILDHMKEAGEVLDQWKQSTSTVFDHSICNELVKAFTETGLTEVAEKFRSLMNQKCL